MRARDTTRGYTIIEVIISLFIIGVVLIIYSAASNTVILNRSTKFQEVALRIASAEMDTLRALPYNSLPSSGPFSDPLLSSLPSGTATLIVTAYNATTKEITATVTWREPGDSATKSVSLTTLITQGGI